MSIFPKRLSAGEEVIIHNAFHLSHMDEGIHFPLLEINIIDPKGGKTNVLSQVIPIVKSSKDQEQQGIAQNKETRYKYSPWLVAGRYFSTASSEEDLDRILNGIATGKNFYHTYRLPADASPGKYLVETIHYLNGEKKYSQNIEDDFFYVEQLDITYSGEKVVIRNLSPEACPIRYMQYKSTGNPLVNSTLKVIKGLGYKEYTLLYPALIQYNEDRKTIPLWHPERTIPIHNPKLMFTQQTDSVMVFIGNKSEAFVLEREYMKVWQHCDGIHSKKNIIDLTSESVYNELLTEGLILENPYAI